jgi:hypothetical protein
LDKSTRHHLSALDAFIKQQAEANKPRQHDEFTLVDYCERLEANGHSISPSTDKDHLRRLIDSNAIAKRAVTINRTQTNLYRFL